MGMPITNVVASACFGDTMGLPVYNEKHNVLAGILLIGDAINKSAQPGGVSDSMYGNEVEVLGDPGFNARIFSHKTWITSTICQDHPIPQPDFCNNQDRSNINPVTLQIGPEFVKKTG